MSVHRNKYLAFSLAGAFFGFVSLFFGLLVISGFAVAGGSWGSRTAYSTTRPSSYQPPMVDDSGYGGHLVATANGRRVELPAVKTDYDVDVRGDLVAVQVTQRFENPGDVPLNATYQFPMHEDAAVYAMTMRIGGEVIRAVIQEKGEAKKTYEAAVEQGKAAALTEQHRPNVFTQKVGNLMPGKPVEIELRYVHAAERRDGRYHLALPLVVGPRFTPADMTGNALVVGDNQELPPAPATIETERVSINVRIDAGMPLADVRSASHTLDIQRLGRNDARVGLAAGHIIDNHDFDLSYAILAPTTQAGLLADWDPRTQSGYFSLLVEPPADATNAEVTPREMVFVLDCSGSMSGHPMAASKAFMRRALHGLRRTDSFRVIRFSDAATEYSQEPIEATPANIERALEYVDGLSGMGGTHMKSGIMQALGAPPAPGTIRLVTFMTDGYIGNDFEIVKLLRDELGEARLFAIGVGTGPNRYLIDEMARTGRGFARYVDPTTDVDAVSAELAERLQSPLLTDISIRMTEAGFDALTPAAIPDLFAGQSVRVAGTYTKPGAHTVSVVGNVNGRRVEIPITVTLPGESTDGDAVRLMWARAQIADQMHLLTTPFDLREMQESDEQLKANVTRLGLEHSLMTQWTSFVAVSDAVINKDPAQNVDESVPGALPEGTNFNAAYGTSTTPEPGIIGGVLMTLLAAGGGFRRRRREEV